MLQLLALLSAIGMSWQAPTADEGCNSTHLYRAADGECRKDYKESPMLIPKFCSSHKQNYQCINNTCVGSYAECKQMSNLTIQTRTECQSKDHKRCNDGYCRVNCDALKYSNCPLDQPIKCGDGRCMNFEFQCGSYSCPLNKPFLCPDMECAPFLKNCTDTMAFRPFKTISVSYHLGGSMSKIGVDIDGTEVVNKTVTHLFNINSNFEIFAPPKDSPNLISLKGKTFDGNCSLDVTPVARMELMKVNNTLVANRTVSFDESYPFEHMTVMNYFTVRSTVLNISTSGRLDNNEYFGKPIVVRFNYDPIKQTATTYVNILKVIIHIILGSSMSWNYDWKTRKSILDLHKP